MDQAVQHWQADTGCAAPRCCRLMRAAQHCACCIQRSLNDIRASERAAASAGAAVPSAQRSLGTVFRRLATRMSSRRMRSRTEQAMPFPRSPKDWAVEPVQRTAPGGMPWRAAASISSMRRPRANSQAPFLRQCLKHGASAVASLRAAGAESMSSTRSLPSGSIPLSSQRASPAITASVAERWVGAGRPAAHSPGRRGPSKVPSSIGAPSSTGSMNRQAVQHCPDRSTPTMYSLRRRTGRPCALAHVTKWETS